MSLRRATAADLPDLERMLRARIDTSMFPLANLRDHGLDGDAPNGTRFWLLAGGAVGLTTRGMLLPQAPDAGPEAWAALAHVLRGERVTGAIGPAAQVRACCAALGLPGATATVDRDEPAYALDLVDLAMPERAGFALAPIGLGIRETAVAWRLAFDLEVLGTDAALAPARAAADIEACIARGSHRVLLRDGAPVAMTGFNAALPGIVQVGGVYVPPDLRRRGHARRAVALHLAEARATGVTRAVLFTASDAAARAYTAIGFRPSGTMALVVLDRGG